MPLFIKEEGSHDSLSKAYWVKNVGDDVNSWYALDIGPHKLINPDQYTITYGNDGEGWEPRNWKLLGSVDNVRS